MSRKSSDRKNSSKSSRNRNSLRPIHMAIESLESRRLLDGSGLTAQFFNTTDLTGTPVTRVDPTVNFNWTNGAPDNALNPDNYTARWSGQVQATYSQTYTFSVNVTGGARLWVNNSQIINQWSATGTNTYTGTIALTAGQKYAITLEYAEKTGNAAIALSWSSASQSQQIIPQSALYSWTDLDIGSPATAGSSSYNTSTGVLTVSGAGSYLTESSDQGHYALQQMTGDVEITARLTNVSNSSSMVGLTIRDSTAADAKAADMLMWGGGAWFLARDTAGTKVFGHNTNGMSTPLWIKLVRVGSTLTGYYSTDGVAWIAQWGHNVTMGSTVQVGFVVSSLSSSLTTATFDNVSVGTYKSDYTTSWIGNSQNGAGQWIPNDMKGIYVDPATGTLFSNSPYDEGGNEAAAYQNGQNIGGFADLHGWSRAGGWGIVADDNYVYLTMSQGSLGYTATGYPDAGDGWQCIRRYSRSTFKTAGWTGASGWDSSMLIVNTNGSKLTGLTMIGNNLYVSDPTTNQVKIYNKTTMTYVGAFSVARPGHMAVDGSSNLWIVSYADASNAAKILKYDSSGNKLTPEITGIVSPTGIAYNPATGQLLVADDGPRQQILKYSNLTNASPTLAGTLGDYGGITSGTPGQVTPTKFDNPGIVAADNAGNIYVGFNGLNVSYTNASIIGIGAVLRSFNSSGTLNWEMRGLEFVDSGAVDPTTDGMDIYTKDEHFTANYSVTGTEMGTWVGRTVDETTNPTDSRLSGGDSSVWIKTVAGQSFMFTTGQAGMGLTIYKKVAGTELWKQCASITETRYEDGTYTTIWRDTNNDGVKQSSEVVATNVSVKEDGFGFDIDSQGNVWSIGYYSGLRKYAFTGLDAYGNPSYSSTVTSPNKTTIFNMIGRCAYDAATDTMYLAGWTNANPIGSAGWGVAGSTIARYDNWSNTTPTLVWSTVLPYDTAITHVAKAISLAGNRLFVGYVDTATVRAYDTATGALVEDMTRGPEIGGYGGWLDTSQPINSFRRSNGEYVITVEDDLFGKVFIMRAGGITPTSLAATAASSSQINLTWSDNNSKESGFVVQRSTDGTNFSDIATLPANMTSYSATGLSAGTTYYFRVRANNSFDNSPWSSVASATTSSSVPAAPSNLAATAASSSQINLTWTDNSSNETGFSIDRATNSGFTTGLVTTSVGANVTNSNITGLSASTTYYFRVRATGSSGNSAYTSTASATTQAAIPAAPSGLTATAASSSQINLAWTDNSSNETGFSIDRATNSTFTTGLVTTTVGAGVTTSNITGLSASTTYYFRVRSTGSAGNSAYTATANATTQATGSNVQLTGTIIGSGGVYGNDPNNTRAAALDGNLSTFYDADSASSAWLGYDLGTAKQITQIKYAPRAGGYASRMTGGVFQASNTSDFSSGVVTLYTIASAPTEGSLTTQTVTDSNTYRYVRYLGPTNGYCNVAEVQFFGPGASIPTAPSGLGATAVSSSQINLAWTDNSSNETGFSIDRATNSTFTTGLVTTTVSAGVTSSNITGLSASTTYYFRVKATGSGGDSAYTATANATTNSAGTPVQLTGTIIGSGGVYGNDPNNTRAAALDGNLSTFYDADSASSAWLGYDLGTAKQITSVKYAPRAGGYASRMTGGVFQASNTSDFSSGVVTLYTIASAPTDGTLTTQTVTDTNTYRYVRYMGPTNGYCNVAEVQFFGMDQSAPTAPSGLGATAVSSSQINLAWTDNSSNETGFSIDRATNSTFTTGLVTTSVGANVTSSNITGLSASTTYYFRVRATGSNGNSAYTSTASATTQAPTSSQLTGTTISAGGTYGNDPNNGPGAALDGSLSSFYDAATATGAWVGLDLGTAMTITSIKYAPRASWGSRMVGGVFQVSNTADFSSGVTTIYTIGSAPTEGVLTTQNVSVSGTYRYVRYLSPTNGYCNVAEVQFFGY